MSLHIHIISTSNMYQLAPDIQIIIPLQKVGFLMKKRCLFLIMTKTYIYVCNISIQTRTVVYYMSFLPLYNTPDFFKHS